LAISLTTLAGSTGSAKGGVEIKLSGRFYAEPATVQMIVEVEPSA